MRAVVLFIFGALVLTSHAININNNNFGSSSSFTNNNGFSATDTIINNNGGGFSFTNNNGVAAVNNLNNNNNGNINTLINSIGLGNNFINNNILSALINSNNMQDTSSKNENGSQTIVNASLPQFAVINGMKFMVTPVNLETVNRTVDAQTIFVNQKNNTV